MIRKIATSGSTRIPYYVHGLEPRVLIHAGIHGDEAETGAVVLDFLKKHIDSLPDFVFVPKVCPSAVSRKTRVNKNGIDLNRAFVPTPSEPEAIANMQIVTGFHFDLLVSFHEDVEFSQFYMYDSKDHAFDERWRSLQQAIRHHGVSLLNGIDDPSDPVLNYNFVEGYCYCPKSDDAFIDGTFEDWAMSNGVIKRWIMPEIPSTIKFSVKKKIVADIFSCLVLPLLRAESGNEVDAMYADDIGPAYTAAHVSL